MPNLLVFLILFSSLAGNFLNGGITVTRDEALVHFPDDLQFTLSAESSAQIQKVSLHYGTNAVSCQSGGAEQVLKFDPAQKVDLEWTWELLRARALPPGAQVWWQWEILAEGGDTLLTERQAVTIQDNRYTWQQVETSDGMVQVQWHYGERAFGESLLQVASAAVDRLQGEFGVELSRPVLITIYASSQEVRDALLETHEWTGGVSMGEYSAILLGGTEEELDWLKDAIPHELAHQVVNDLVFNCKGAWVPTWLNEGLAVVAEKEISAEDRQKVIAALESGELKPLHDLERGFTPYGEQVELEYQFSGVVVEYMVAEYGSDRLLEALLAIQSGLLVDDALKQVYNFDTDALETAFRLSEGLAPLPTARPTQPGSPAATRIPTLALYTSVVQPSRTPVSSPTSPPASATPTIRATTSAPADTAPPEQITPSATPAPAGKPGTSLCPGALGLLLFASTGLWIRRRRRSCTAASPSP